MKEKDKIKFFDISALTQTPGIKNVVLLDFCSRSSKNAYRARSFV